MSYYSVLKYTPNPLSEESINFGLLAFSGAQSEFRVTEDWHRAQTFGRKAPDALREAVQLLSKLNDQNSLTETAIRKICEQWQREVTLTTPRASTLPVLELVDRLTPQMLRFPAEAGHTAGKRKVLRVAKEGVLGEMVRRYKVSQNRARGALRVGAELEGRLKEHTLDLAVFNGAFLGGAIGASLTDQSRQTERELDGVAFVLDDLRGQPSLRRHQLYVLGHTRGAEQEIVAKASRLFGKLGGVFVPEKDVPAWSRKFVADLPEKVFAA